MQVTSQAKNYAPALVLRRYVRKDVVGSGYSFCEVGADRSRDMRQGRVSGDELPENVRALADAWRGQSFGYVDWPLGK